MDRVTAQELLPGGLYLQRAAEARIHKVSHTVSWGGGVSRHACGWEKKSWSRFEWCEAPQGKMGSQSRADSGGEWEGPPWEALVNRCVCLLDGLLQAWHYSEDVWPFFGSQDPPTPSGRVDDQKRYSRHQEHIVEEGPGIMKSGAGGHLIWGLWGGYLRWAVWGTAMQES